MPKSERLDSEVVKTGTVLDWVYRGFRESIERAEHSSPLYGLQVSHDGDHKGSEIIITDRNGTDWVIRENDIRRLPPDEQ
jgi:hypothetical protein